MLNLILVFFGQPEITRMSIDEIFSIIIKSHLEVSMACIKNDEKFQILIFQDFSAVKPIFIVESKQS